MRNRSLLVIVATGAMVLPGCASMFQRPSSQPISEIAPSAPPINTTRVDQSPIETAKLCLATAQQLEASGNLTEAASLYENARRTDPKLAVAVARRLAVIYDKQDNFDRARVEYESILQKHPDDADTHNNLGYGFYCRGNWQMAEQHLRKAVTLNPNHKRAWTNLGMTLAQLNQQEESLNAFRQVVSPAQAYCNLAFVFTTQGRRDDAKQAYRQALALDPDLQLAQGALRKLNQPSEPGPGNGRPAPAGRQAALSGAAAPTPLAATVAATGNNPGRETPMRSTPIAGNATQGNIVVPIPAGETP